MLRNLAQSLAAILIGNLVYFLLMPWLPAPLQHGIARLDWGLALDFCICLVTFGMIRLILCPRRLEK